MLLLNKIRALAQSTVIVMSTFWLTDRVKNERLTDLPVLVIISLNGHSETGL